MDRRILSFLVITFGLTWIIAGVGALCGVRADPGPAYMILAATCMLMPAVAALVQQRLLDRGPWSGLGLSFHQLEWKPLVITALIGMSIIPLCLLVIFLLGDIAGLGAFGHVRVTGAQAGSAIARMMDASGQSVLAEQVVGRIKAIPAGILLVGGLLAALLAACTVNLPFMLGEELGWRGYLYQRTSSWKGITRVLFTGAVWGLWHAPLILMGHNYPEHPLAGVPLMVVFCILLALLFDWSRARVNAVWGPCLLHGLINGSAGLFMLFASEGHPLIASPTGLAGFMALALLGCAVLAMDRSYRKGLFDRSTAQP